jgi:glutamyl-Q tRNA(Asp) synthetase
VSAAKSSTATGTTATADRPGDHKDHRPGYRGRFAPSPTGLLHIGSLVTALASWLDARAHRGQWLIRIEDLDTPRVVPGAEHSILATLSSLGLESDAPPLRQSQRSDLYREALDTLRQQGLAYRCLCARSEVEHPYAGTCRDAAHQREPSAWRLRLNPDDAIDFDDRFQGPCHYPNRALGDPVIFRRDGLAAYQLAVVVDDLAQGITDVVRGADLLESTAWQLQVIAALKAAPPRYAHVPLVVEADGAKLAKSRHSVAVGTLRPGAALVQALTLLRQAPPEGLEDSTPADILDWGIAHWNSVAFLRQLVLKLP